MSCNGSHMQAGLRSGCKPYAHDKLITTDSVHGQIHEGLLSKDEAEECIGVEFNPVRAGFAGGEDVWTRNVLNLGVRPDKLIAKVHARHATGNPLRAVACADRAG